MNYDLILCIKYYHICYNIPIEFTCYMDMIIEIDENDMNLWSHISMMICEL